MRPGSLEKGIQLLSNTNMVLAVVLAVIVFVGGRTLFILNVIPNVVAGFIDQLPQMASRTAAAGDESLAEWMSRWTVFYWAWWVSWCPFVGLFIGRISRGRTIRQFVVGVLLVPSVVTLIWFAIVGGGAIGIKERAEKAQDEGSMLAKVVDGVPDINFDTILFSTLDALPVPGFVTIILMVLAVVLVAIWKDLSKDPLMIRSQLARHVLEDAVDSAIDEHDGEPFSLHTVEAVVEVTPKTAKRSSDGAAPSTEAPSSQDGTSQG